MSRPVGSKNYYPNKRRLEESFKDKGFDFAAEFHKLYAEADKELRTKLILGVVEFLFPKRRPEDDEGNPDQGLHGMALITTPEMAKEYIIVARGKKPKEAAK